MFVDVFPALLSLPSPASAKTEVPTAVDKTAAQSTSEMIFVIPGNMKSYAGIYHKKAKYLYIHPAFSLR